jgi:hypothetical protein
MRRRLLARPVADSEPSGHPELTAVVPVNGLKSSFPIVLVAGVRKMGCAV